MFQDTRLEVLFRAMVMGLVMAPGAAWAAAAASTSGPVERWPMVVMGVVLTALGLKAARVSKMWMELGGGGRVARVLGVAVASVGVFVGAFSMTEAPPLRGEGLSWETEYELARARSKETGKPVMLDFTAKWCAACHELEAEVFEHKDVSGRLREEFILVKIDFDRDTPANRALLTKFEVGGLPRVAFEGSDATFLRGPSFEGKLKVPEFLTRLEQAKSGGGGTQETALSRALGAGELGWAMLLVFVAGVLSSLTPCVYPLIPITISIFGASEAKSRWHGFTLSLTYVLGIALTYSSMGVAAASAGTVFGGAMQSPWVLVGISGLFVVLGLSSLEVFEIRLPGALQTRLSEKGGAGYVGAFVMGLVAGVIAAPCVGPIVAGILLYVAQAQDLWLGWWLLWVFSWGMGLLFLVLGTFSALIARLPRSGGWMVGVKVAFGAVFFGMSLYYLRFVVPGLSEAVKGLWGVFGTL